jgi:hypothetical protein
MERKEVDESGIRGNKNLCFSSRRYEIFSELDLDALYNEDYFEEQKQENKFGSRKTKVDKNFTEKLQELNTRTKRGKICYQCPYCLKFYAENGMYGHIDATNDWKRKCKQ